MDFDEIPVGKSTDQSYLLAQVKSKFHENDKVKKDSGIEMPNSLGLDHLLEDISKQKKEWDILKQRKREERKERKMEQTRAKRLLFSKPVKHPRGWNFSSSCDRQTEAEYCPEDFQYHEINNSVPDNLFHHNKPWLPTCLLSQEFGDPSLSRLNTDFKNALRNSLHQSIHRCEKQLSQLNGTTDDVLSHRMKCHQAVREFKDILEELDELGLPIEKN